MSFAPSAGPNAIEQAELRTQPQILFVSAKIDEEKLKLIRAAGYAVHPQTLSHGAETLALSGAFDVVAIDLGTAASGAEFLAHVAGELEALRTAVVALGTSAVAGANFAVPPGGSNDLLLTTLRHAVLLSQGQRRRYARVAIKTPVEITHAGVRLAGMITDAGHGGVALQGGEGLSVGTILMLRFQLPGSEWAISALGEVRWQEGTRCGVLFRKFEADGSARLANWLACHLAGVPMAAMPRPSARPADSPQPRKRRKKSKRAERLVAAALGIFVVLVLFFWLYMAVQ